MCWPVLVASCDERTEDKSTSSQYPYSHVEENDCVPRAAVVKEALTRQGVWARVVLYYFEEPRNVGHAVCVYVYSGKLWTYDALGSYTIDPPSSLDDVLIIAQRAEDRRKSGRVVRKAEYLY